MTDHPRMRGVYAASQQASYGSGGSSPHARGLQQLWTSQEYRDRIIPACAGFTHPNTRRKHCR